MMQSTKIERVGMALLSFLVFGVLFYLAKISPGVEGGMDSYNHYLIARFSWLHPSELLLDQWGKPIYNILASPFAQFGMMGVIVFNILLLIGTAWLAYFAALRLHFKHAWVAFVLCIASPIWFGNTISGLTEPLNAFLLMLVFYLFARDRVYAGAILSGFLPFARSEGYVIMAVIGLYLLFIVRNYKAFGLLLVGMIFMNFLGWAVEGEPLWIYTKNPYIKYQIESTAKQENICGHGELLHYWKNMYWMMGKPRLWLFLFGAVLLVYRYLRNRKDKAIQKVVYLALGVYALYFFIHSWIWYKGMMGSCGYPRVMVVIEPLAALVMAFSAETILNWFDKLFSGIKQRLVYATVLIGTAVVMYYPYKIFGGRYPIQISQEQELFVEVADWYNQQDYEPRMKYFLYPYFNILADIDPKDTDHFIELWSFDARYAPVGSIVIWDGHFGPNEGNVPLEMLENHQDFKKIKSFYPQVAFKTLNDYNFEIHVFERTGDALLE
jgi:hypothetical protein